MYASSISLGAGNLGAAQVAHAMIDAVSNFTIDRPKAVNAVHIVIFQPKMLSDFVEALKNLKKITPTALPTSKWVWTFLNIYLQFFFLLISCFLVILYRPVYTKIITQSEGFEESALFSD